MGSLRREITIEGFELRHPDESARQQLCANWIAEQFAVFVTRPGRDDKNGFFFQGCGAQ
jgi:hypothetical protein